MHYINHNQKLFELGENGTLAILTWGLGSLGPTSHRSLIPGLVDDMDSRPAATLVEVAERWSDHFWSAYSQILGQPLAQFHALQAKPPFDPVTNLPLPDARTQSEEEMFQSLRRDMVVGFCLGGYVLPDRTPRAYEVVFDPATGRPSPQELPPLSVNAGGVRPT
jgi:hypothetical protein